MVVDTYIEHAKTRVQSEQEAIEKKLAGYESFISRVSDLQTHHTPSSTPRVITAGATHLETDASGNDYCRKVQTIFAETIGRRSLDDPSETRSILDTISDEFTDAVAVALAPTTEASFTPRVKQLVLTEARSRQSEVTALQRALIREESQLDDAATTVNTTISWICDANETPLTDLDYDALKHRHAMLSGHLDCCETVARERQEFLNQTTNNSVDAGIRHRSLIPYLYQDFPVEHPVLATIAELIMTCHTCQRTIRDHLIRRV